MKKFIFVLTVTACAMLCYTSTASSQALTFNIMNNTGVTLNNIYVTPSETTTWGNDILPESMFDNGATVTVSIPADYGQTCKFDVKITDVPGNAVIFKNVDACALHTLTINGDGTYQMQ